jgi:tetratricopeptide (TPR) repeat protein
LAVNKFQDLFFWYHRLSINQHWALDINPNNVRALINKGFALANLGQYEEAIGYYDKALAINPIDDDALDYELKQK